MEVLTQAYSHVIQLADEKASHVLDYVLMGDPEPPTRPSKAVKMLTFPKAALS